MESETWKWLISQGILGIAVLVLSRVISFLWKELKESRTTVEAQIEKCKSCKAQTVLDVAKAAGDRLEDNKTAALRLEALVERFFVALQQSDKNAARLTRALEEATDGRIDSENDPADGDSGTRRR